MLRTNCQYGGGRKTEGEKHRHLPVCYSLFLFLLHKHNSNSGIAVESIEAVAF